MPINLVRKTMSEHFENLCLFDKAETWNRQKCCVMKKLNHGITEKLNVTNLLYLVY